jgi:hypothetical protein
VWLSYGRFALANFVMGAPWILPLFGIGLITHSTDEKGVAFLLGLILVVGGFVWQIFRLLRWIYAKRE